MMNINLQILGAISILNEFYLFCSNVDLLSTSIFVLSFVIVLYGIFESINFSNKAKAVIRAVITGLRDGLTIGVLISEVLGLNNHGNQPNQGNNTKNTGNTGNTGESTSNNK
jgi:hypothetical protein